MTHETVIQSVSVSYFRLSIVQYFRNSHRHTRYALFFHSLALIACIREEIVTEDECKQYLQQVAVNQTYIRRYVTVIGCIEGPQFLFYQVVFS